MTNIRVFTHAKRPRRPRAGVSTRRLARLLGAAVLTAGAALLSTPAPSASAQPCPDVEAVFARGSGEPPGAGGIGQQFVDALGSRVDPRSYGVYPVDYEASTNFDDRLAFATSFVDGVEDARDHIEATAANCPRTRMVFGGYSQGAALAAFTTAASAPKEIPAQYAGYTKYLPKPLPLKVADHVAAVVLFGLPSNQFLTSNGAPPITIGPSYRPKTIELCAPGDTVCDGEFTGTPSFAHLSYGGNGSVDQAVDFAASRL
jgi:hypothetical protein